MKQFSLIGLLRLRGLEEQLAAAELARANRAANDIRSRRARTRADLAGTTVEASGMANLAAMAASRAAGRTLLAELAALERVAQEDLGAAADGYRHARSAALGIEKLHDRQLAFEQAEELRAEQGALDEVALGAWGRSRSGRGPEGRRP